MYIPIVVIVLGLIGLVDSLYYTFAHYGVMGFGSPLMPVVCDSEKNVCEMLASTNWASVLGIPNSVFGLGYYALVLLAAGARLATGEWMYPRLTAAVALLAAVFSVYLAWLMITQVRAICPLCVTAQSINVVLAGVFIWVAR